MTVPEPNPDVGEFRDAPKIERTLIQMGDKYRQNGELKRAIKSYDLAGTFLPHEAQEKLSLIPQQSLPGSDSPTRLSFRERRVKARVALVKVFRRASLKSPLKGPFFPKGTRLSLPLLISQNGLTTQGTVGSFREAQDTNTVVNLYIGADPATKLVLHNQIIEIIKQFDGNLISLEAMQELVILAKIPDSDIFSHIITQLLKVLKEGPLHASIVLQGMAVAINSFPEGVDISDLQETYLDFLRPLQQHLEIVRSKQDEHQLIPLLYALSALLNAIVCKKVSDLYRDTIFNPLIDFLDGFKSHDDTTVVFLALYTKQALSYVGNDESLAMSISHRARLAIAMTGDIAGAVSDVDLSSLELAYNNFTAICDFSAQVEWFSGLVYADSILELQNWTAFETFVLQSKFKLDDRFLEGVCLRLEQIAATQQKEIRVGAIQFLQTLATSSTKVVEKTAQATLRRLGVIGNSKRSSRDSTRRMSRMPSDYSIPEAYQDFLTPVWDPIWHTATRGVLLKAVHEIEDVTRDEIREALHSYYKPSLFIQRVSGDKLDLEPCYINLAVVEAHCHWEKDRHGPETQEVIFQRLPNHEKTEGANLSSLVPLEGLFDKRKLRNGSCDVPKTILIHGRAGIGKTTLCKKIVHQSLAGEWKDIFVAVLWLPLRELESYKSRDLESLLREKYFARFSELEGTSLARALFTHAQSGRVLLILDGLDEFQRGEDATLDVFLSQLLRQRHVLITSRSSSVEKSLLPSIDLEFETVGFSPQNVRDYLQRVVPEKAETIEDFIDQAPVIQGLVNIPIQLDAICFSWDSLPTNVKEITMTELYQTMVRKLWREDVIRSGKTSSGRTISASEIQGLSSYEVDKLMHMEMEYLGHLALNDLMDDQQIVFDDNTLNKYLAGLNENRQKLNKETLPSSLVQGLKQTSFLHSEEADVNSNANNLKCSWCFLHMTFQEYFAATWVARHLTRPTQEAGPVLMMTLEETKDFVRNYKYDPRFEVMWWIVAGLLEGETLVSFFDLLEGAPVDLIGGYHHQLLAACLKEGRIRLDAKRIEDVETRLEGWLQHEMKSKNDIHSRSGLGSMSYFPEELLIRSIGQSPASQGYLIRTLEMRASLTQPAIGVLLDALQDEDRRVRISAAEAIGTQSRLPESAILALVNALQDEYERVRVLAAKALGRQSILPELALLALVSALHDGDRYVRSSVAEALGTQSPLPEAALTALIRTLQDENEKARISAADAFRKWSKLPEVALLALIAAFHDENWDVRHRASDVLGGQSILPESALLALDGSLHDLNPIVRKLAASALGKQSKLPESALITLVESLHDENEIVRNTAADALGKQSKLSDSALKALLNVLNDDHEYVRKSAVSALGKQSMLPESALLALAGSLKDQNGDARYSAAEALGKQSTLPESVLQALIAALQDENWNVRKAAADALGKQSKLTDSALMALVEAFNDRNWSVRCSASDALGNHSPLSESALLALTRTLKVGNEDARSAAAHALGMLTALSESVLMALIDALEDKDENVRKSVVSALGNRSTLPESGLQALVSALRDEKESVRYSAAEALGMQSILPESVLKALVDAFYDENSSVRGRAASDLGNQPELSEPTLLALVAGLEDESEVVRKATAYALGNQPTLPEPALQALIRALQDEDEHVRDSAADALGRQATLPESVIQKLISELQGKDEDFQRPVVTVLEQLINSTFMAIPHLSPSAIETLHKVFFVQHGSQYSASLWVQGNQVCFNTAHGPGRTDGLCAEDVTKVVDAFDRVRNEANLPIAV